MLWRDLEIAVVVMADFEVVVRVAAGVAVVNDVDGGDGEVIRQ